MRTGLYGFHHPSHYSDLIVRPIRKLNTELIVAEIEHFATASVVGWSEEDTAMAVQLVVARLWTYASGS